jgi:hypothetical protein
MAKTLQIQSKSNDKNPFLKKKMLTEKSIFLAHSEGCN